MIGVVYARDSVEDPVAGATVSVLGTAISTTTNALGQFTLENVPNGETFFVTRADGSWGVVDFWDVPDETAAGADFGVVPDSEITALAGALGRTLSEADGIVDVTFYEGAEGGETATISASSDLSFTFTLADDPIVQDGVIADNTGFGELIYTSVDPADGPITATVMGAPGVTDCVVDHSPGTTYPILAKSVTIVYAYCSPQ